MIGGTVIETIETPDKIWINCREDQSTSECAIYVEKTAKSRTVSEGDAIWWQGETAMWTPKTRAGETVGKKSDITLRRIGSSGAKRPQAPAPHSANIKLNDRGRQEN